MNDKTVCEVQKLQTGIGQSESYLEKALKAPINGFLSNVAKPLLFYSCLTDDNWIDTQWETRHYSVVSQKLFLIKHSYTLGINSNEYMALNVLRVTVLISYSSVNNQSFSGKELLLTNCFCYWFSVTIMAHQNFILENR